MTKAIRWRIIVLQVVAILVFAFGAGAGIYASNFIGDQVHSELAAQQIYFPKDAASGLPSNLSQYAGQQVLTGEQAHAYADQYLGLHLQKIGQGKPYSYWSGLALQTTDPAAKVKYQATADTLFKGETLRFMLNQAWTFSVVAQIALAAGIAMIVAAAVVLGALAFEVYEMVSGKETAEVVTIGPPATTIQTNGRQPAATR